MVDRLRTSAAQHATRMTPAASRAFANIKAICNEHLPGQYTIEIIDLLERPELADEHQIFAVPTIVRQLPPPLRKIIGDLANADHYKERSLDARC